MLSEPSRQSLVAAVCERIANRFTAHQLAAQLAEVVVDIWGGPLLNEEAGPWSLDSAHYTARNAIEDAQVLCFIAGRLDLAFNPDVVEVE